MKFAPLLGMVLILAACGPKLPACPTPAPGTPRFLTPVPETMIASLQATPGKSAPVEIGRKIIQVDRIIEGPLCNDKWEGTIYVTCNVQVLEWTEVPDFFKDCNLEIKPNTVVYVGAHYDSAYYNGCSCHTGELETPAN